MSINSGQTSSSFSSAVSSQPANNQSGHGSTTLGSVQQRINASLGGPILDTNEIGLELTSPRPFYTNLDVVSGSVRYPSNLETLGRCLTVSLLGITRTTDEHWNSSKTCWETRCAEWVFLRKPQIVDLDSALGESRFSFNMPETLQPVQCPIGEHRHLTLPPTIGAFGRTDGLYDMTNVATDVRVVYLIKAELRTLDNSEVIGHAAQSFLFVPRRNAWSPDDTANVQHHRQDVKSVFGRTLGSLVIAADTNAPLLSTGTSEALTSTFRASLIYKGTQAPVLTGVSISLRAHTAKRLKHRHFQDQMREFTGDYTRKLHTLGLASHMVTNWTKVQVEKDTWHANISLPVTLSDDKQLAVLPSFETCLVDRTYELCLKLHLQNPNSYLVGLHSPEYALPVEIVVPGKSTMSSSSEILDGVTVKDGETELMPSYEEVLLTSVQPAPIASVPVYSDPIPDFEALRRPSWSEKDHTDSLSWQHLHCAENHFVSPAC